MHVKVILHGNVQGVFCRDSIKEKAISLNVFGYARNREDGTVEAVFEGNKKDVEEMILFSKQGPGRASVDNLEVFEDKETGFKDFETR